MGTVSGLYGSYQNGVWLLLPLPPAGYNPLYFASAVLPDGRVIIEGGEYNNGVGDDTTLGRSSATRRDLRASVLRVAGARSAMRLQSFFPTGSS